MFIRKISIIIILIWQRLRSVGPVQQKTKLPLPYMIRIFDMQIGSIFVTLQNYFVRDLAVATSKWIKTDILFNVMIKERCKIDPVKQQNINITE